MCFTPFPPMRQRAVLFPVSHRPASAIMHNSTSNTNQLGSPPRKAHCRLLAIDLSHGGQRAQPQPHPHPRSPVGLPSSPWPPLLVNCSLLHITRNPRSLRCRPVCVRVRVCRRRGEEEEEEGKPLGRFHSVLPWRLIFSSFPPHKTSLLKHRALVHNSTEKETHLAWDLRVASTSDGCQTFARSFHALGGDPARQ
ncbi:uncharacterized protein K444DRAFT_165212 [Hyaloscypha bicolor E]|uniref:Uncharacterized protein n=1 Tax=Hyaloscypha bicolor E TaxID=1095630 RepID=A0A2J6TT15_9HELO|nr:uncharacterized protein K444DRAFT_165212 [Hyaloscypha bicolor E]PMD66171.1 hypothetical protein K444DRAFT_165212 [Hyaloscypha bicolor E]